MKLVKRFSLVALLLVAVLSLASCKGLEGLADDINKAAEDGEAMTYSQVMDELGDDVINYTADVPVVGRNGVLIKVKGCANWEEINEKLEAGKTVKGIVVTVIGGKATAAEYREITPEDAD